MALRRAAGNYRRRMEREHVPVVEAKTIDRIDKRRLGDRHSAHRRHLNRPKARIRPGRIWRGFLPPPLDALPLMTEALVALALVSAAHVTSLRLAVAPSLGTLAEVQQQRGRVFSQFLQVRCWDSPVDRPFAVG